VYRTSRSSASVYKVSRSYGRRLSIRTAHTPAGPASRAQAERASLRPRARISGDHRPTWARVMFHDARADGGMRRQRKKLGLGASLMGQSRREDAARRPYHGDGVDVK